MPSAAQISVGLNLSRAERDWVNFIRRLQIQTNQAGMPLGAISRDMSQFGKSLDAATARVLAFGATAGIIINVQRAFGAMAKSMIDVEKFLADINVVLQTTDKGITRFGTDLFEVARRTGQSFDTVAKAATEFSRQGLGIEKTIQRTSASMQLMRLSGMDAMSAVDTLTSALNSFGDTIITDTQLVSKMVAVDQEFAVSVADLAEGMKRVGSTAQDVGVDLNSLLGMITSLQQTTARGGAVIGNALKTIFTRITTKDTLDQLENMGVAVRDMSDQMLPATQLLENLATAFANMGAENKNQTARMVGGVYQINILRALLKDLSRENSVFEQATRKAANATNEAAMRNSELNRTLAAQLNRLRENAREVGAKVGGGALSPLFTTGVEALNSILESTISKRADDYGEILGKGIIKGLGSYISGPGILAIATVLSFVFQKMARQALTGMRSMLATNFGGGGGAAPFMPVVGLPPGMFPGALPGRVQAAVQLSTIANPIIATYAQAGLLQRNLNQGLSVISRQLGGMTQPGNQAVNQARVALGLAPIGAPVFTRRQVHQITHQIRTQTLENQRLERLNRFRTGALLGAPFLQMGIEGFLPEPTTQAGRAGVAGTRGISTAATIGLTAFGLGVPGVAATGIGAAIGGIVALRNVIKELSTVVPELGKTAQDAADRLARENDRIQRLASLAEKTEGILQGRIKAGPREIRTMQEEFIGATAGLPGTSITAILSALRTGNVGGVMDILEPNRIKLQTETSRRQFLANLPSAVKDKNITGETLFQTLLGNPEFQRFIGTAIGQQMAQQIQITRTQRYEGRGKAPGFTVPGGVSGMGEFLSLALGVKNVQEVQDSVKAVAEAFRNNELILEDLANRLKGAPENIGQAAKEYAEMLEREAKASKDRMERTDTILREFTISLIKSSAMLERGGIKTTRLTGDVTVAKAMEEAMLAGELPFMSTQESIEAQFASQKAMLGMELPVALRRGREQAAGGILQAIKGVSNVIPETIAPEKAQVITEALKRLAEFAESLPDDPKVMERLDYEFGELDKTIFNMPGIFKELNEGMRGLSNSITAVDTTTQMISEENLAVVQALEFLKRAAKTQSLAHIQAEVAIRSMRDSMKVEKETVKRLREQKLILSEDYATRMLGVRRGNVLTGEANPFGDAGRQMLDRFEFRAQDMYDHLISSADELAITMRSGFKDAFKSFVDGSNSAKEALRSLGLIIADKLLDISIGAGINALFGGVTSMFRSFSPSFRNKGGIIGYASGGFVGGGSRVRDDVPAMLNRGDFVVRQSSVSKFGTPFFNALNSGVPRFQSGGGVNIRLRNAFRYNDPRQPTSGFFDVDPALSALGQTDELNPQNLIKFQREQELYAYIQDRQNYLESIAASRKSFKNQQMQRVWGSFLSAAITVGGAGLMKSFGPSNISLRGTNIPQTGTPTHAMPNAPTWAATGGVMAGSTDKVPALLTGGEYIVRRDVVNRVGLPFMERLNRGQMPGFQSGGAVPGGAPSMSSTFRGDASDTLSKLLSVSEAIRDSLSGGRTQTRADAGPQTPAVVNDIVINVSVMPDSKTRESVSTTTRTQNSDRGIDDATKARDLAEKFKAMILQTIIDQKRPDGLLDFRH